MKAPNKSQFKKLAAQATTRLKKIQALDKLNDSEARKSYKQMAVHHYGRTRQNLNGFYHPNGKQPLRCK